MYLQDLLKMLLSSMIVKILSLWLSDSLKLIVPSYGSLDVSTGYLFVHNVIYLSMTNGAGLALAVLSVSCI